MLIEIEPTNWDNKVEHVADEKITIRQISLWILKKWDDKVLLEEKKHVADEIEDDTGVVGGVRAQDRHADGEEGLMEEHDDQDDQDDQDDHNDQDD